MQNFSFAGDSTEFFLPLAPCIGSRQLAILGIFFLFYFFSGVSYIARVGKKCAKFQGMIPDA